MQRFLWHAEDLKDEQLKSFFISALVDMRASLIFQDADQRYVCITGLPSCWTIDRQKFPDDELVFGTDIATRLAITKKEAHDTGLPQRVEIALDNGSIFEFRTVALASAYGPPGTVTIIIDRTEEHRHEAAINFLLREGSHRSKNLLAIIQSIANQTWQYSKSMESFSEKFRGRIFSLSRSQDLITDSGWEGARLETLLRLQLTGYVPLHPPQIRFSGENPLLSPGATLHLGLAFYELAMNAVKFMDSTASQSHIEVSCRSLLQDGATTLSIEWLECGVSYQENESRIHESRFDRIILERVVPLSLNGSATLTIGPNGVTYSLKFPIDRSE